MLVFIIIFLTLAAAGLGLLIMYYKNKKSETKNDKNCLEYEEKVNDECQCINGYVKNNENKCVQTQAQICTDRNEQQINGICQCIKGYTKNNENKCVQTQICTDPNEEQINKECQCKLGYEYSSDKKCVPLSLTLYGHYNNPILGFDIAVNFPFIFDDSGIFRGTTNIKKIDIFDGFVNSDSIICCDKNGKVYHLQSLSQLDNWNTFDAKEKGYCRICYGGDIRMIATLSGNIFKNEKKITSLNLNKDETVVAFLISTFAGTQQIIFTSEGRVYISVNSGDTWSFDNTRFKLQHHQLKISLSYATNHFYLLSDMKLYKVTIESEVVYTPVMTDFEITCFDVFGQDTIHFYGSRKDNKDVKIMCLSNRGIILTKPDITGDIVDIKQYNIGLYVSTSSDVYKYDFDMHPYAY